MANELKTEKKVLAISMLCEGSSIRAVERVTGVHRDTIMRLVVPVGEGCKQICLRFFQSVSAPTS
jgi:transposase-like protein